jgi:hypothetical protein
MLQSLIKSHYFPKDYLPKKDDKVVGCGLGGSSTVTRLATLRRRTAGRTAAGLAEAAGSSSFIASCCPSNTVVSQLVRLPSIRTAQIFAAAAASLSGPAANLSCMPCPVLLSFTTMIGRKAASAEFDFDLSRPRHSARKPPTEFAVPTSTANSVRWTVDAAGTASACASSAGEAAATASGPAAAGASGGTSGAVSLAAAASGGAMIDFAGISGAVGVAAGAFDAICPVDAEPGSEAAAMGGGLSGIAEPFAAAAVATGATAGAAVWVTGGSALAGDAGADDAVAEAAVEADGADEGMLAEVVEDTGAEDGVEDDAIEADWEVACGEAAAAFCRAIEPVTESRPCSRTVTREYSRSRSLLRVSMADASRRVSFWLSLAIDWICCDCRARSTLAICSRRHPIAD